MGTVNTSKKAITEWRKDFRICAASFSSAADEAGGYCRPRECDGFDREWYGAAGAITGELHGHAEALKGTAETLEELFSGETADGEMGEDAATDAYNKARKIVNMCKKYMKKDFSQFEENEEDEDSWYPISDEFYSIMAEMEEICDICDELREIIDEYEFHADDEEEDDEDAENEE